MPTITIKPLSWFRINSQVRKHFEEGDLRRLGESLKVKQLQPVVCQPDATLICGERRHRAATLVGLESLEVKILDEMLTATQVQIYQLTENLQRNDLTGPEQWQACLQLKQLNNWSNKELATHLQLDPSMITRILSPSDCIPAVQKEFQAGRFGTSKCYAISKHPPEEQEKMLARLLGGATRDELESMRRNAGSGRASAVKVMRVKAPLPSGVEVVISGKELALGDVIETLGELLKEAKKASDSGLDVKTWAAILRDKAKASEP